MNFLPNSTWQKCVRRCGWPCEAPSYGAEFAFSGFEAIQTAKQFVGTLAGTVKNVMMHRDDSELATFRQIRKRSVKMSSPYPAFGLLTCGAVSIHMKEISYIQHATWTQSGSEDFDHC